jgi:WD40 repeat protein
MVEYSTAMRARALSSRICLPLVAVVAAGCASASDGSGSPRDTARGNGRPATSWRPLAHCPAHGHPGLAAYTRQGTLRLLDLNHCRRRVLVARGARSKAGIAFSADGRWLAFGDPVRIVAVDGKQKPRRAFSRRIDSWAWSPHGATLAGGGRDGSLRVRRPGHHARTLLPAGFGVAGFVWAPSGRKLEVGRYIYPDEHGAASGGGVQELLSAPVDGSRPRPLYRPPRGKIEPPVPAGFSPDGRFAFFWPDKDSSASLAADGMPLRVVSARGGPARGVLGAMLLNPHWLTFCAGRAVIVAGGRRFTLFNKHLVTAQAPDWRPRELTSDEPLSWVAPACSPDGRRIAAAAGPAQPSFHRIDTEHRSIWLLNPRTGAKHKLTSPPPSQFASDEQPQWSADGRYILFQRRDRTSGSERHYADIELARVADGHIFGPLARLSDSDSLAYAPRARERGPTPGR